MKKWILMIAVLVLGTPGLLPADDTEIYGSGTILSLEPNILIIFDFFKNSPVITRQQMIVGTHRERPTIHIFGGFLICPNKFTVRHKLLWIFFSVQIPEKFFRIDNTM